MVDGKVLIEKLKGVDLLMIPVGGTYTIDYKGAIDYINKISPKAVIPMHYHIKNSTVDIDKPSLFLDEFKNYETETCPFEFKGQTGVIYLTSMQGE